MTKKSIFTKNLSISLVAGFLSVITGTLYSYITGFDSIVTTKAIALFVWIVNVLICYLIILLISKIMLVKLSFNLTAILITYNFSVVYVLLFALIASNSYQVEYVDIYLLFMQLANSTFIVLKISTFNREKILKELGVVEDHKVLEKNLWDDKNLFSEIVVEKTNSIFLSEDEISKDEIQVTKSGLKFQFKSHGLVYETNSFFLNNKSIANKRGIYCFIVTEDFEITLDDLFLETIFKTYINEHLLLINVPKLNLTDHNKIANNKISFIKGQVFYCGQAEKIRSRFFSHVSGELNKTSSLKLGINGRSKLKLKLKFYYQDTKKEDKTKFESHIKNNYHVIMGDN